jgi:protein-S-isoprenylcysteine O-methyltransferase Ste14
MTKLALTLYLFYLLAAFGWRGWIQYRRTGDHGFRGFSGRVFSIEWIAGASFATSLIALLAAPVAVLLGLLSSPEVPPLVAALGVALALAGFAVTIVAQLDMGASWRVGVDDSERTELVSGGLFRVVRNPIFSGLGLFALGFTLLVPNVLSAAGLLFGALGIELQVRWVEEPFRLRTHGNVYADYARRVGRFLPGLGRIER